MAHCININHPEVKQLIKDMGLNPAITAAKISVWQTRWNMFDRYPTVEELGKPVSLAESEVIQEETKRYKSIFDRNMEDAIDHTLEKAVNDNLNKLFQRIEQLKTLRGGDYNQQITENIDALRARAVQLSDERTYEKLADVALFQLAEVGRILHSKSPLAFEISEAKRVIEYTKDFDKYLLNAPEELRGKRASIRNLNIAFGAKVNELIMQEALKMSKAVQEEVSIEDLTKAYKDTGSITGSTLALETSHIPTVRLIGKTITRMNRLTEEHFETNFKQELHKLLQKLGKKKFETQDFQDIMEDNALIMEFKPKYFTDQSELWKEHYALIRDLREKIANTKNPREIKMLKSQIKDSYDGIFDWYKNASNYYLTPENIEKYNADLESFRKSQLSSEGELKPEGRAALNKWIATNSPYLVGKADELTHKVDVKADSVPHTFISGKKVTNINWHRYLTATPKDTYLNPKWAKASENPLHQFMMNKYIEAMKMLPREVAVDTNNYHKFLNEFTFDLTQSQARLNFALSGIKDIAEDTFRISINQAMIDGGIVKNIYNPDGSVSREFIPLLQTKDEKGNPIPQIKHQTIQDLKEVQHFKNPVELLQEFYKTATAYNHKLHTQSVLDLLLYQLEHTPGLSANQIGTIMKDVNENPEVIENGLVNAYQQSLFAVNAALSGRSRTDTNVGPILTSSKKEELAKKTEEWAKGGYEGPVPTVKVLSAVKASDALVDYTRMTLIGLKPFTAVTNLVLGLVNNYIYAARNREFNESHLDVAFKMLMSNAFKFYSKALFKDKLVTEQAEKNANLSEKFGITNTLYETRDPDVVIRTKNKIVKFMYSLQEGGEFLIANQALIAMMLNTKITSKSGEETNLYEAFDKDGNLKPEFNTPEWSSVEVLDSEGNNISKLNSFRNSLDAIRKRTQGDYQSPIKLKGKWYGRILMMFRTWISQAVRERFGAENGDFKGRYRSYLDTFTLSAKSKGFKGVFETTGMITLAAIAKMTNILPLGKYRFTKVDNLGTSALEKHLESIGASDLDIENLRANVKELQFILMTIALTWGIKALAGDDDDEDFYTKNFLLNINQRIYSDLTAFVDPRSALSIVKDPLPIMKTIKEGIDVAVASMNYIQHPESRYYERGFRKGDLKLWKETKDLLPIYSALQSTQNTMTQIFGQDSYRYSSK